MRHEDRGKKNQDDSFGPVIVTYQTPTSGPKAVMTWRDVTPSEQNGSWHKIGNFSRIRVRGKSCRRVKKKGPVCREVRVPKSRYMGLITSPSDLGNKAQHSNERLSSGTTETRLVNVDVNRKEGERNQKKHLALRDNSFYAWRRNRVRSHRVSQK